MDILFNQIAQWYKGNDFPEGPYRLEGIGKFGRRANPEIDGRALIALVHPGDHVRYVERSGENSRFLAEVHTDSETFSAAVNSVKLAWSAAQHGNFSCTRPPGHHATPGISKGFCFFNNMAIVAQALVNEGKRVCIIDIDGHHGDGTEQIFYASDQVLFFSIHQEFVYPYFAGGYHSGNTFDSTVYRHGEGAGEGFTWNLPVPAKSGDDVLIQFILRILPKIKEFTPEIIGISAGFDGYFKDGLLNLSYTQHGYYEAGKIIGDMDIKTFALLEGGYHRDVMECIHAFTSGFNCIGYPSDQETAVSEDDVLLRFQSYLEQADLE